MEEKEEKKNLNSNSDNHITIFIPFYMFAAYFLLFSEFWCETGLRFGCLTLEMFNWQIWNQSKGS